MYSFALRTHQKIDRAAYVQLKRIVGLDIANFPLSKEIIHFEGKRGPDATRLKKGLEPAPWHFYAPHGDNSEFLTTVASHYNGLVVSLESSDLPHAAFEAAWLAHALVDGLTPAHHYPYKEELAKVYGENIHNRTGMAGRVIVKGDTKTQIMRSGFKIMGPKGLLTTHTTFEAGAATIILPMSFTSARISNEELIKLRELGYAEMFERAASHIDTLNIFGRFLKAGWTPSLARAIKRDVAPNMVKIVTLAWLSALASAGLAPGAA